MYLAFNPNDDSKESFDISLLKRKEVMVTFMDGGVISDAQQVIDNGEVKVSMEMDEDGSNIWKTNYRF